MGGVRGPGMMVPKLHLPFFPQVLAIGSLVREGRILLKHELDTNGLKFHPRYHLVRQESTVSFRIYLLHWHNRGGGMTLPLLPMTLRIMMLAENLNLKTWRILGFSVANYTSFWMLWDLSTVHSLASEQNIIR
uniref:Uncharacterized protein n=1 Tax=Lepeophtheirus salmonis TaxID=72036 RepID=A0A0K2VE05_LEPSM